MKSRPTSRPFAERTGFTFIEVLAAMLFMAILVPVVTEALTLAHRSSVIATRSATALQLAENHLAELILDDAWLGAEPAGDFAPDWPTYRYELTSRTWAEDDLVELELRVAYDVQGREHTVQLTTLVVEEELE